MNNVQKINYGPLGADLRIIIDDDQKIWFVASDIAKILEYKDSTHMLRGLDDDEQSLHKVERLSGQGAVDTTVITESGLYHVILNAKTERVKPFRRWVTEEVLPQIRKTANYIVKIHPILGIAVRSDGYVMVKRNNVAYCWTAGSIAVNGYKVVKIGGKQYKVHRLIAETFLSNPSEKPTVDHINRIRDDNRIENLRWATYREQRDNSSSVINRIDYGFRSCEDRTGYDRMRSRARRAANPEKYSTYLKEYRLCKKAMGMIEHKCPDGHRRWHKPGECPVCH